ncbi:MAG: methyltransferase domain-containing protein [Gammaproteobacteria bacterium]
MDASDFLFVGDDLRIHSGSDAEVALRTMSDARFVVAGEGIPRVPKARWLVAQRYEKTTWMEVGAHADDDRNHEHARHFDEYAALHRKTYARALEVGCGPFTNLRLIANVCRIDACTLLDPLLNEYLHHRHCTYRHGFLETGATRWQDWLGRRAWGRYARAMLRRVQPRLLHTGVTIDARLAIPFEEMPAREPYDLTVMINVLEHCFDAPKIFARLLELSRPGAVLVFHDKLFRAHAVERQAARRFDAGHPLRVDATLLRAFLFDHYRPLHERYVEVEDGYAGVDLSEQGIYFIGERI